MASEPKHFKVTPQHVRTEEGWSVADTYSQSMTVIRNKAIIFLLDVTAANLTDLNYYWSYTIPFNALNRDLSDPNFVSSKKAQYMQEELLNFVSQKFVFDINNVASTLGIPSASLSNSYDPANWEAVVHGMISESSSAFTRLLELPSVNSLAKLVDVQPQDLLNANLSRFEDLVFRFIPKKAIVDANTTSYLITSSGIILGGSYNDATVAKILQQHENITLSIKEFGILYNLTNEQVKAIGLATFYQIFRTCGVSTETILNITLPEVSLKVVGSMRITPPCPVLIAIKGKSIASFEPEINPQNTTVLEILTTVSNLTWRNARLAVNASLPDWEFLDSVTLTQLATISGNSLETLLNDSVSEMVELVFRMRANGTLNDKTDIHRAFIRRLLEEKFNVTLIEVANLTGMPEVSFLNASSPSLFRSFLNATFTYFRLNVSHIVASVQVSSEDVLYNLPRQEWKSVISAVINSVIKSEAADLQMSADNFLQFLGVPSFELSISQLKRHIKNQILEAKIKKTKFEADAISLYLTQNSVSDADYLNSTVLSLVLAASGYSKEELKLANSYSSDEIFILGLMRIGDLPLYCVLNTSAIKDRTPYNITAALVGIRGTPAVCKSTRLYVAARFKNMSLLQIEFSPFSNSTISFVRLVELVTDLPWRRNVWALGLRMEDWTVLYVLSEDSFKEVTTDLNLDSYESRTLLQIFGKSVELQRANNSNLRVKIQQDRAPTLKMLYDVFNTNENELIKLATKNKQQFDVLLPIEVFSLMIDYYLVGKFNVSVRTLEMSLDLEPGDLYNFSPTEWPEMIQFVKAEVIRSGQHQLGMSLSNFAKLLHETPDSLQSLTFVQIKSKWDSVIARVLNGKRAIETESVSQTAASDSLNDVTVLVFTKDRINVSKSELLLLYNFSSIAVDVLSNYTFGELPVICGASKEILFNKTPLEIIVSLLGHDNDMSCTKIAAVAAASSITVNDLADKFNFSVNDNVNLLTMFEDLFKLPWPKIAWAVNASLPDWPIVGALTLNDTATLTSQSTQDMKMQKSFRGIVMELLSLSENSYTMFMNSYRTNLATQAANLFGVNSSKICDDCNIVDILWNSLTQLNLLIVFDPDMLPNDLNVSSYEFNLTIPSQWPLIVQPIVRAAYSRAFGALGMDRDRLSTLLQTSTATVENMNITQYKVLLIHSIQPFIAAKTTLSISPLAELVADKRLDLPALANESVFDVIDALLSVPMRNISFIFNWTSEEQARLKNYTLDDMTYYKGVGLQSLGNETLLGLVKYVLKESLPPRTPPPTTLAPCKRGFIRVDNDEQCIPKGKRMSNALL